MIVRRALIAGLGASAAALPCRAAPVGPWLDYEARLRARLHDAGFQPSIETALLAETNRYRQSVGRAPLAQDAELALAARAHAADMAQRNYFAHETPEAFTSIDRAGLIVRAFIGSFGENLAYRSGGRRAWTAPEIVTGWRNSRTHRENLARAGFTHVGHGVVQARGRWYAAAVYGVLASRLRTPMAVSVGASGIGPALAGADPQLSGFTVSEPHGEPRAETWSLHGRAPGLSPGAWRVRPLKSTGEQSYVVLWGPIVVL